MNSVFILSALVLTTLLSSCKKKEIEPLVVLEEELVDNCFIENDVRDQYLNKIYKVDIPLSTVHDVYGYSANISQFEFNALTRQSIYFKFLKGDSFIALKLSHYNSLADSGLLSELDVEYLNQFVIDYENDEGNLCKNLYFQRCNSLGEPLYSDDNVGYKLSALKSDYKFWASKNSPVTILSNFIKSFDNSVNLSQENCEKSFIDILEDSNSLNKGCTGTSFGFNYCLFNSGEILFNYKVSWDSNICNNFNVGTIEYQAVAEVVNG